MSVFVIFFVLPNPSYKYSYVMSGRLRLHRPLSHIIGSGKSSTTCTCTCKV